MPTPVKALDNMSKHLTLEEIEAREQAETALGPARTPKPPKSFTRKTEERKIWDRVLADMEGCEILDRLDTDVLEIYCRQLVRLQALRDTLEGRRGQLLTKYDFEVLKEIRSIEASVLSYASKLGLTPESRARLARRMAEQEPEDPDDDLFA